MELPVDTAWKRGRRIVDVFHLANQMDCTQCKELLDLRRTRRETRVGLASVLDILCSCGNVNRVHTDRRFKTENGGDAYLVNTLISSSKYLQMMKIAPADLLHILDIFCVPVTLPLNAVTDSSTPSPATASMTCSDISDTQTVTPGDVCSSNSRNLHLKRLTNMVERYSKELLPGSGESTVHSRELIATSETETSSDLSEEYFHARKPELLHLQETDCFKQDSQHGTELCEGVKVDSFERDSHPVKCEDNHYNGEIMTSVIDVPVSVGDMPISFGVGDVPGTVSPVSVSDVPASVSDSVVHASVSASVVPVSVSASDVPVSISASDVPVSINASDVPVSVRASDVPVSVSVSGKTAPAHLVVKKQDKKSCKSGIKRKYALAKLGSQRSDMPLEDMIQTFPVAAASDEPGGSQSDGTSRKRFQCRACNEQFVLEIEAYTHVRCHTGSICLRCFRCGMEFNGKVSKINVSRLEAHLNQHDGVCPDSSLSCQQCSYRTRSQARFKIHLRSHTTKRECICDICGSILSSRDSLRNHKRRLHDKHAVEYSFACELCEKRYLVKNDLVRHQKVHRNGDVKAYQCHFCPETFKTKKLLNAHERTHSGEKPQRSAVPPEDMIQTLQVAEASDEPGDAQSDGTPRMRFQCRACNEQFTSEMKAYTHVRRHTGSHNLRCFRCGVEFIAKAKATNVSLLEVHLNQHDNVRPYVCEVCPKTSQSFSRHNQHMREVHNYEGGAPAPQASPLSCQHCAYHTHSKARLRIHLRSHRTQRERICDVCGLVLSCRVTLKHHKERMHDKRADEYRFACELCEKRYRVRGDLVKHQLDHKKGDVRAYQCQFCPKAFKTKNHLNMHERIHTGEKPYQCQLCEAAFVQKPSLDWHMKKHGAVK